MKSTSMTIVKMFSSICFVAALTILSGCASLQGAVDKAENKLASDVQTASLPDLENAKALASTKLAEPQRSEYVTCFNDVEAYVAAVVAATTAPPGTGPASAGDPAFLGLATGFVDLQLASQQQPIDLTANIPPVPHQLEKDCAIVVVEAKLVAAKLGLTGAALAAAVKTGQLQGAAAVLKATRP